MIVDPSYDEVSELNDAEKSYCKWPSRWKICNKVGKDRKNAEKVMYDHYDKGFYKGKADAFRHCWWNALMVESVGVSKAAEFATRHEEDDNDALSRQMDLRNNRLGRNIGEKPGDRTWSRDTCKWRADAGWLWTVRDGVLV